MAIITRLTRGRKGPAPTAESVVVKDAQGCCPYCHLEHSRKVEVNASPIIGGGIKCPSCGRRWHDWQDFGAAAKALIERVAKEAPWIIDELNGPTKEEKAEEEQWQKQMDEAIRKHKKSLPKDWWPTPFGGKEDSYRYNIGVDGFKDDVREESDDAKGTTGEVDGGGS